MIPFVQNKERLFGEILNDFFDKKEITEFSEKFLGNKSGRTKLPSKVSTTNRFQVELDIKDEASFRSSVDLLITFASTKLDKHKFLEFLLTLGQISITAGEFPLAVDIHEKILSTTKKDPLFVDISANAFFALGELYSRQAQWQASRSNIKKADDLFKKMNDLSGRSRCENLLGTIQGDIGNMKKAKEHFEKSLTFLDDTHDKALRGKVEINLGITHTVQENFDTALSYFKRASVNFQKISDLKRVAEIHHNIGMVHLKKNYYEDALVEFDQSISASLQAGFLPTLSITYISKAYLYTLIDDFVLSSAFAEKAMDISYKINDKLTIAEVYKVKGIIERNMMNFEVSENYLLTSMRLNTELGNKLNQAETAYELGLLYKDINRKKDSRYYLNSALQYYKKINAPSEIDIIKDYLQN